MTPPTCGVMIMFAPCCTHTQTQKETCRNTNTHLLTYSLTRLQRDREREREREKHRHALTPSITPVFWSIEPQPFAHRSTSFPPRLLSLSLSLSLPPSLSLLSLSLSLSFSASDSLSHSPPTHSLSLCLCVRLSNLSLQSTHLCHSPLIHVLDIPGLCTRVCVYVCVRVSLVEINRVGAQRTGGKKSRSTSATKKRRAPFQKTSIAKPPRCLCVSKDTSASRSTTPAAPEE